jgi:hypothetical protein
MGLSRGNARQTYGRWQWQTATCSEEAVQSHQQKHRVVGRREWVVVTSVLTSEHPHHQPTLVPDHRDLLREQHVRADSR